MSTALLRARGIGHRFGTTEILSDVDVEVPHGRLLVVVGPNGAGKTTLLRILAGVLLPAAGRVEIDGVPLSGLSRRDVARRVAVVPQELSLPFPYRVREMVAMGRAPFLGPLGGEGPRDREVVGAAIARLELGQFQARTFGTLSGGEKQRVVLARALAQTPRLMLLDEPTAHMDLGHRIHCFEWLRDWIAERPDERGGLLVTHDLILAARYADRISLLADGREIASGAPASVLTPERIARVYGVEAEVTRDAGGRLVIVAQGSTMDYIGAAHEPDR